MILVTIGEVSKIAGTSPTQLIGLKLAEILISKGKKVRILGKNLKQSNLPPNAEIVEGMITNPLATPEALKGIDRIFLADMEPGAIHDFVDIAKKEKVTRVVVLSSHGPEHEINYPPETWFWLAIERAIENSGMEWSHIRPSAVMGSMFEGTYPPTGSLWPEMINKGDTIKEPLVHAAYPFIDEDDLAEIASVALIENGYTGKIIEAGGKNISAKERLDAIRKVLHKEITLEEINADHAYQVWRNHGWPDETIEVVLNGLQEYGDNPEKYKQWTIDNADPFIQGMLGRSATSFHDWVAKNSSKFNYPTER